MNKNRLCFNKFTYCHICHKMMPCISWESGGLGWYLCKRCFYKKTGQLQEEKPKSTEKRTRKISK